jgi:flagellar FliL protein
MAAKGKGADADDEAEAAAPSKKTFPLKLVIIAVAALVVLGGGGAAAYFVFGGTKEEKPVVPVVKPVAFMDIPDLVVNLAGTGGGNERTQYLKIRIVLEVPDQAVIAQITPLLPRVMDAFQTFLRELRPTDLEGSAGLYRLKEELTRRVNAAIEPARINAVLFKELVVQ